MRGKPTRWLNIETVTSPLNAAMITRSRSCESAGTGQRPFSDRHREWHQFQALGAGCPGIPPAVKTVCIAVAKLGHALASAQVKQHMRPIAPARAVHMTRPRRPQHCNAFSHQMDGLAPQRSLQAVRDVPRHFLVQADRLSCPLADRMFPRRPRPQALFSRCPTINQRDQMRWVKGMPQNKPRRVLQPACIS